MYKTIDYEILIILQNSMQTILNLNFAVLAYTTTFSSNNNKTFCINQHKNWIYEYRKIFTARFVS